MPRLTPVATPVFRIVATLVPERSTAVQVVPGSEVLSMVVASLNVSTAVNCCSPPTTTEASLGVTTNDTDVASVTVKLAVAGECGLEAKVAVMTTAPGVTPVARPPPAPSGESDALALLAVQAEAAVLSKLDPSLNVSVAVYCWVPVTGTEAVAGVTTNDTDVASVTVKLADAGECGLAAKVAVMTTAPDVAPVARPPPTPSGESVALVLLAVQAEAAVLS